MKCGLMRLRNCISVMLSLFLISSISWAQVPRHIWSQSFGDSHQEYCGGVAVKGSGNVLMTGSFSGTVDFGGGPLTCAGNGDIFVAKFDADGNHLWSQRFGDEKWERSDDVALDGSGNVFVTGSFDGTVDFGGGPLTSAGSLDIFVVKFDAGGNHLWSRRFGDFGDTTSGFDESVAVDGSGNVYITGPFSGTMDFGGGPLTSAGDLDIYVAKLHYLSGDHIWSKRFGDANIQKFSRVAVDGSGNVLVAGTFEGTVDFGGGPLTSAGYADIFVTKFNADGNHLWSQSFGDTLADETCWGVAVDGLGNVLATGLFGGNINFGGHQLTSAGLSDVFVTKFNADGNHLWSQRFGDECSQSGKSVAVDSSGNVFVTGRFDGTVDFGGGPLTCAGPCSIWEYTPDIFIAKFGPETVPTLLQGSFATVNGTGIEISWRLAETGVDMEFFLFRAEASSADFRELNEACVEQENLSFTFVDKSCKPGVTYCYRVDVSDELGRRILFVTDPISVPALSLFLYQNCPNPFNPSTTISFTLPKRSVTELAIYDVEGKLVTTFVDGTLEEGYKKVTWDGIDAYGNPVSSGIYFYRLKAGGKTITKKMILLK